MHFCITVGREFISTVSTFDLRIQQDMEAQLLISLHIEVVCVGCIKTDTKSKKF